MTTMRKGSYAISADEWLRRAYPGCGLSAEQYIERYGAELFRDGWQFPSGKAITQIRLPI